MHGRAFKKALSTLALALTLLSTAAYSSVAPQCELPLRPVAVARIHQQFHNPICMACSGTATLENLILRKTGKRVALSVPYMIVQGARIKLRKQYELWGKLLPTYAEVRIVDQDFIMSAAHEVGIIPQEAWEPTTPLADWDDKKFNLEHIWNVLVAFVKNLRWPSSQQVRSMFDQLLFARSGMPPETFVYQGKTYTPASFAEEMLPKFEVKQIQVETMRHDNVGKEKYSEGGYEILPVKDAVEKIAGQIDRGIPVPAVFSYNGLLLKGDVFSVPKGQRPISFALGKDFRHGMIVVDYTRDNAGEIEWLKVQDSKGVNRGAGGFLRIHRSYFIPFLRRFQQITLLD